jgi:heptose-I-phosphate ethanolaminephosphotransferase
MRLFLFVLYGLEPDSVTIVEALANTTPSESREFVQQLWPAMLVGLGFVALLTAAFALLSRPIRRPPSGGSPRSKMVFCGVLAAVSLIHLNGTERVENPPFFWADTYRRYADWQKQIEILVVVRRLGRANVAQWAPRYSGPQKHTVVFVIGESVNRWNWSLYGYPRRTTPKLEALGDRILAFTDVISSAASTIPSVTRMLSTATAERPTGWEADPTVSLLARAAGYKVFWFANQNVRSINALFAAEADRFVLLNRGGHRGDRSDDDRLLPLLQEALEDPADRKFIVLHMLGAHQNYDYRYPPEFDVFSRAEDEITARMKKLGRNFWVRFSRAAYDNAMLYQDHLLSRMIGMVEEQSADRAASLLFASDHGQEVGHFSNHTGHSFTLESGYVIPLIVWANRPMPTGVEREALIRRPYQTDALDWTLLSLLHIKTNHDKPEGDLLGTGYVEPRRTINGKPYRPGKPDA